MPLSTIHNREGFLFYSVGSLTPVPISKIILIYKKNTTSSVLRGVPQHIAASLCSHIKWAVFSAYISKSWVCWDGVRRSSDGYSVV